MTKPKQQEVAERVAGLKKANARKEATGRSGAGSHHNPGKDGKKNDKHEHGQHGLAVQAKRKGFHAKKK